MREDGRHEGQKKFDPQTIDIFQEDRIYGAKVIMTTKKKIQGKQPSQNQK